MGQYQRLSDIRYFQPDALSHKKDRYDRIALTKGRKPFDELNGIGRGHRLAICGSGPSLKHSIVEIKKMQRWGNCKVLACNTAHEYLREQGVKIDFAAMLDPRPWVKGYMTPQIGTKYLLASQVHPDVWPVFDGFDVYVWHCLTSGDDEKALSHRMPFTRKRWMKGGNTIGLRSFMWSRPEWADFDGVHLFGFDSSFDTDIHVTPKASDVKVDKTRNKLRLAHPVTGQALGRSYTTNGSMMTQADWFSSETKGILAAQYRGWFKPSFEITVHGDGLLPDIAALMFIHADGLKRRDEVLNAPWEGAENEGDFVWDTVHTDQKAFETKIAEMKPSSTPLGLIDVGEIDWSGLDGYQTSNPSNTGHTSG